MVMVGGRGRSVKASVALALVVGCGWRAYGRMMATHTDVLVAIAHKGVDLLASGRLTAESMPELTYPLERAQAFARRATAQDASRPSLAAFATLCTCYRDLIDALDRIRREQRGDVARQTLAGPLARVDTAAGAVRTALAAEGW